ncbi:hypothetical protein CRYUN_Cryun36dG0014800 [Craigia yunnanensis]
MASSPSSLLLPLGSASGKSLSANHLALSNVRAQGLIVRCSSCKTRKYSNGLNLVTRRDVMGLLFGVPSILLNSPDANGAGLPPEEKPKLCDDACEKELENEWLKLADLNSTEKILMLVFDEGTNGNYRLWFAIQGY